MCGSCQQLDDTRAEMSKHPRLRWCEAKILSRLQAMFQNKIDEGEVDEDEEDPYSTFLQIPINEGDKVGYLECQSCTFVMPPWSCLKCKKKLGLV